jgi:hypothetical protein
MPTQTIIVVVALCVAFATFAGVLAWGDFRTRDRHSDGHPAE